MRHGRPQPRLRLASSRHRLDLVSGAAFDRRPHFCGKRRGARDCGCFRHSLVLPIADLLISTPFCHEAVCRRLSFNDGARNRDVRSTPESGHSVWRRKKSAKCHKRTCVSRPLKSFPGIRGLGWVRDQHLGIEHLRTSHQDGRQHFRQLEQRLPPCALRGKEPRLQP